jgi:hypothetical protein
MERASSKVGLILNASERKEKLSHTPVPDRRTWLSDIPSLRL